MLFFRLFKEERKEENDRHVLNLICDSGWLANVILQKRDRSQSQGTDPISPNSLPAGASSLAVSIQMDWSELTALAGKAPERLQWALDHLHRRQSRGNGGTSIHMAFCARVLPAHTKLKQRWTFTLTLAQETQERNPHYEQNQTQPLLGAVYNVNNLERAYSIFTVFLKIDHMA